MKTIKALILTLVLLAAAGCSKDGSTDRTDSSEISFRPAALTKSSFTGVIQNSVFPEDKTFSMNAFVLPLDEEGHPVYTGGSYFMNMETVTHRSDGTWRTDGHHYWPVSGCCYFLAFHPTIGDMITHKMITANSLSALDDGTLIIKDMTIKHVDENDNPIEIDSLKKDTNIQHTTVDFMTSTNTITNVRTRATNSVSMPFTHQLAQLNFSVRTEKDYSSHVLDRDSLGVKWYWTHWQQFWIDEIMITDVYSTATFSLAAPNWPQDSLKNKYTYYPLKREEQGGTQAMYLVGSGGVPGDEMSQKDHFGSRTPVEKYIEDRNGDPLSVLIFPQYFPSTSKLRIKVCSRSLNMLAPDQSGEQGHIMNDQTISFYKTFNTSDIVKYVTSGTSLTVRFLISLDSVDCDVDYTEWLTASETEIQQ